MDEMPDLSHLTEEERKIIEKVILRQKQEEEREHEIMRKKQDEVHVLEQTIRQRSEQQKKAGVELDATCHICLKTKFADGVGHICNYCNIRCCARCGGKVTLRSNKVIWVCILCRKKQELLSKTGQWINKGIFTSQDTIMSKIQADLNQQQFPGGEEVIQPSLNNDKRPKLERTLSAVEKENLPLQRSGSQLRRQYSQQEQSTKTSDQSQYERYSKYTEEDPRYYRAEIDDLMRSAPYYGQTSQSAPYTDDKGDYEKSHLYPEVSGVRSGDYREAPEQPRSVNFANGSGSAKKTVSGVHFGSTTRQPQRSFSSSEDDLRSTPDFAGYGDPDRAGGMDPEGDADNLVRKHHRSNHIGEKDQVELGQYDNPEPNENVYNSHSNKEVSENGRSKENNCYDEECRDAISAVNGGRRHSISSDFHTAYSRAYQIKNGMKRGSAKDKNYIKQAWYESIRDRYQSTNRGFKKDIVFPKSLDNYRTKYNEIKNTIIKTGNKLWEEGDKRRLTERRKKTVRFDGGHESNSFDDGWMTLDNIDRWDSLRQGSQDSGTKDSGIETSSNFTSSEDSNKGDFKYPMSWHLNQDGTHLIGHMILNRSREPADSSNIAPIIGLKVDGNRILENGRRGALIEKVKEGSIADIEGGLRPGDEIIEWNGRMFRGASNQEVANVIAQSKHETQVELVVSRPVKPIKKIPGSSSYLRGSTFASPTSSPQQKDSYEYKIREKPSVRITSPGSPDVHSTGPSRIRYSSAANANVGGRIEIKVLHDAAVDELVIIVTCAVGLVPKSNGQPRNPYAKVFLLPDRGEKSKRRTRTVANTNDPKWNQSFIFCGVKRTDLKTKSCEISVWDYAQVGTNDFLGETLIDIGSCTLGHDTWYHLGPHEEFICYRGLLQRREGDMELDMTPTDHLSPPSTMSRFSDSETSDYDETKERRVTDGASLSSIGSSGSPPPEVEMSDRRSRRDMSPQGRKRTAVMMSRDRMLPYQVYKYIGQGIMSQRSHSAAPTESPSLRQNGRTRSQSPKRVGSLSPPDPRKYPSHTYVPRLTSRSATVTPTGSPKKRHLPQIPSLQSRKGTRETTNQDFDERAQYIKQKLASMQRRHGGTTGWDRQFGGLSDSDLPTNETKLRMRDWFSPEKEFGDSDMESVVSITSSAFSTQSERPRGLRDYGAASGGGTAERGGRITQTLDRPTDRKAQGVTKTEQATRSLSGAEAAAKDKDVTASGSSTTTATATATTATATATTTQVMEKQEQRKQTIEKPTKSSTPIPFISGMGKKSNSTSQLSATDATSKKKSGGKQSSRRVHRSVEVVPPVSQQSLGSGSDTWYHSLKSSEYSHLSDFIEGLGPGQLVGRQVLGSSSLGDVQLSLRFQKGQLEVEVVRARGLRARPGSKVLPAPYVKVYLVCGKKCVAKSKTAAARRTLDPLYQTPMTFKDIHSGCILQVTVWGDYGRIEGKKVFMGVAQIMLDDLDLSNLVIGWYKLFGTTSLVSGPPSLGLSRRSSLASLDSLKIL